jgi:hypothetical protein
LPSFGPQFLNHLRIYLLIRSIHSCPACYVLNLHNTLSVLLRLFFLLNLLRNPL